MSALQRISFQWRRGQCRNRPSAGWHGSRIRDLAAQDGGFALELLGQSVELAVELVDMLSSRVYESAEARLARLMVTRPHLVFGSGRPIIRRSELGHFVGASREMCDRIIRNFEQRGLILREGPSGLIELDRSGLAAAMSANMPIEQGSQDADADER